MEAEVIYSSGSTKFGDTSDDTHERTGSLLVSGNITLSEGTQLTGTSSFAITASHATNVPTTASPSPKNEPLNEPLNTPSPVDEYEAEVVLFANEAVPAVCEAVIAVKA